MPMLAPDPVDIQVQLGDFKSNFRMAACGGRDQVVRKVSAEGWYAYEPPLPQLIAQLVAGGKTAFFDVGANTGYYSLLAASLGSPDVRAFEPIHQIAEVIRCNIVHTYGSLASNIKIYETALADHDGKARLFIPNPGHGLIETSSSLNPNFKESHHGEMMVEVERLDTHIANLPLSNELAAVVKIDVESFEPQVLRGAEQFIGRHRPFIIVEILPRFDSSFYSYWLNKLGYQHYRLGSGGRLMMSDAIEPRLASRDHLLVPSELDLSNYFECISSEDGIYSVNFAL